MSQSQYALLRDINKMREKMVTVAKDTGFASDETIKCSQDLDQLIYAYQLAKKTESLQNSARKNFYNKMFYFTQMSFPVQRDNMI